MSRGRGVSARRHEAALATVAASLLGEVEHTFEFVYDERAVITVVEVVGREFSVYAELSPQDSAVWMGARRARCMRHCRPHGHLVGRRDQTTDKLMRETLEHALSGEVFQLAHALWLLSEARERVMRGGAPL